MKKLSIIAWAILAVTLWACSKSESTVDPDTAWAFDETLPVPIQLGGGDAFSVYTKAFEKITSLENKEIRVYAIDLHLGTDAEAQGWSDELGYCTGVTDANPTLDDIYLSAEKARVNGQGNVEFLSGTSVVKRYYPFSETKKIKDGDATKLMHMGNNYSFIAYYAPDMNTLPVTENGRLLKKFSLVPNQDSNNLDVLWARVDAKPGLIPDENELASDNPDNDGFLRGFNARYQRYLAAQNGGVLAPEDTPELKFQHATSLVHIFVRAESPEAEASFSGNLSVTKMDITPKISSCALDLVSGAVIPDPAHPGIQSTSYHYVPYTTAIYPVYVDGFGEEYNQGFSVMPGERNEEERISISFKIVVQGGTTATKTVDLPLPTYTDDLSGAEINGYKAGVEYNYCISIASIEEIFLRTSIREWDSTSGEAQLGNQVITFE